MLALLLRLIAASGLGEGNSLLALLATVSLMSMFAGNLLALLQNNVKRILAYSSIAHLGYLLVPLWPRAWPERVAAGRRCRPRRAAVGFYLVAYFVTMLGAFGVVTVLSPGGRDADSVEDYRGLARRRPLLAGVFTAMLLSLAGIPLTAGFVAKFYILTAGVGAGLWTLAAVLVVNSAIGLFYYLRITVAMYMREPAATIEEAGGTAAEFAAVGRRISPTPAMSIAAGAVLTALTSGLVWLGVYPSPMVDLIRRMLGL